MMRAPGMTLMRMPLTVLELVCHGDSEPALVSRVLCGALLLILFDRLAGTSFFIPAGLLVADQTIAA